MTSSHPKNGPDRDLRHRHPTTASSGRRSLRPLLALLVALAVAVGSAGSPPAAVAAPAASAADYCSGQQLAIGANWSVCWEIRANEGLVVTNAYFTRPGIDRRVLSEASIAQIFVPYETGTPRYHDVAYGLGPAMVTLSATADCPDGTLLAGGKVCREVEDRGVVERFCVGNCATRRGRSLTLWSASQMGAYNYTTKWEFNDDGSIEPAVGLAGALQFGDTAHVHNVYWRLDIDIDDAGNDSIEEFYRVKPAGNDGSRGVYAWAPLLGETMRPNDLTTFRKWRMVDTVKTNAAGKPWSYELIPHAGDGNFRSTLAEGYTRGELWVTQFRPGERFVSTDTADILSTYITGDPVAGQDLVLWYTLHEHHEVRDEDAPYMPMEWIHFTLRPRNFFDDNPLD